MLEEDIRRVETYIAEHGQAAGTISWQMAKDSFDAIKQMLNSLYKEQFYGTVRDTHGMWKSKE